MPDLQEVFRMSTQKVAPDPGALERQHTRQRRRSVGKKLGAFAVAAAIAVIAAVVLWTGQAGDTTPAPVGDPTTSLGLPSPQTPSADAGAERVAMDFLIAYAGFDAKEAMSYVAEGADLTGLIEQVPADADGLALWLSFLEAQDFEQLVTSCVTDPTPTSEVSVVCDFDFHLIRSQELGRGPFSGSFYRFTVRDGAIVRADLSWDIEEFSPQMWEPFETWVRHTYPDDHRVMYNDDGSNFELTRPSIRLWGLNSERYVKAVQRGEAE
jgi:hypothetical protein